MPRTPPHDGRVEIALYEHRNIPVPGQNRYVGIGRTSAQNKCRDVVRTERNILIHRKIVRKNDQSARGIPFRAVAVFAQFTHQLRCHKGHRIGAGLQIRIRHGAQRLDERIADIAHRFLGRRPAAAHNVTHRAGKLLIAQENAVGTVFIGCLLFTAALCLLNQIQKSGSRRGDRLLQLS